MVAKEIISFAQIMQKTHFWVYLFKRKKNKEKKKRRGRKPLLDSLDSSERPVIRSVAMTVAVVVAVVVVILVARPEVHVLQARPPRKRIFGSRHDPAQPELPLVLSQAFVRIRP